MRGISPLRPRRLAMMLNPPDVVCDATNSMAWATASAITVTTMAATMVSMAESFMHDSAISCAQPNPTIEPNQSPETTPLATMEPTTPISSSRHSDASIFEIRQFCSPMSSGYFSPGKANLGKHSFSLEGINDFDVGGQPIDRAKVRRAEPLRRRMLQQCKCPSTMEHM